jgi:hypothetical protein
MKPPRIVAVMLLPGAVLAVMCQPAWAQSPHATANHATTVTGVIGDAVCGRKHAMHGKSDTECTRQCVRLGSRYALIAPEKIYILQGGPANALDKLAGARVLVFGAVDGGTIHVKSIRAESSH